MQALDFTGQHIGKIRVVCRATSGTRGTRWKCICLVCRRVLEIYTATLSVSAYLDGCDACCRAAAGRKLSRHGEAGKSVEYAAWAMMKGRCLNPRHAAYANYGGRGIKVCARWMKFENFLADMGRRPAGRSLERKDNAKGYCKSNCVWATTMEQARNKRNNRYIQRGQVRQTLSECARSLGIPAMTLYSRLKAQGVICKDRRTIFLSADGHATFC